VQKKRDIGEAGAKRGGGAPDDRLHRCKGGNRLSWALTLQIPVTEGKETNRLQHKNKRWEKKEGGKYTGGGEGAIARSAYLESNLQEHRRISEHDRARRRKIMETGDKDSETRSARKRFPRKTIGFNLSSSTKGEAETPALVG